MARKGDRQRNAKRDRRPVPIPDPPRWVPPDASLCEEETFQFFLDAGATVQMTQRQSKYKGQLVDYAVILSRKVAEGEWSEIASIDCRHGNVHFHEDGIHGTGTAKTLRPIFEQKDVQDSFGDSCDAIWERYSEYVGGAL